MNIKVYRYSLIWNEIHMIYISELVSSKSKFIAPPPTHTHIHGSEFMSPSQARRYNKNTQNKKLSLIVFFLIRRWMQGKWTSICLTKAKYNTNRLMYVIIRCLFFLYRIFCLLFVSCIFSTHHKVIFMTWKQSTVTEERLKYM